MRLKIITTHSNHDFKLDFWNKKKDKKDEEDVDVGREEGEGDSN